MVYPQFLLDFFRLYVMGSQSVPVYLLQVLHSFWTIKEHHSVKEKNRFSVFIVKLSDT